MATTLDWIIIFGNMVSICLAWALGMYILATGILGAPRKWAGALLYFGIFLVLQTAANFYLAVASFNALLWNVGLFSTHAIILAVLLRRTVNMRFLTILSAVALSHFVLFTFFSVVGTATQLLFPIQCEYTHLWLALVYSVLPHVGMFGFGIFITWLLGKMKFQNYFHHLFTSSPKSIVTVVVCMLLMNSYSIVGIVWPAISESAVFAVCILIAIFLALFCLQFVAMFVAGRQTIRAQQETIQQQQLYVDTLGDLQHEMRAFRHDFNNLFSGMALQVKEGNVQGVQDFLKNTTQYFDQKLGKEIKQMEQLMRIQIYPLRSMLGVKLAEMQKKQVKPTLEVMLPVEKLGMRTEDFLRCFGILLDNAMEEAALYNDAAVNILLLQEPAELRLVVSNSCPAKPNMQKMQSLQYSTKGQGRGVGLSSYHKILAGYTQCVSRMFWKDGLFAQELRIMLTGGKK